MGLPLTNNAEGGTNGTTVTTGNSGGTSGTAWDFVSVGGGTLVYDNTHVEGTLAYKLNGTGGGLGTVGWTTAFGTQTSYVVGLELWISSANWGAVIAFGKQGASNSWRLGTDASTGKLTMLDSSSSVIWTSTAVPAQSQFIQITVTITHAAGSGGKMRCSWQDTPGGSVTEDSGDVTGLTILSNADTLGYGSNSGSAFSGNLWIDNLSASATTSNKAITPAAINATSAMSGSVAALKHVTPAAVNATSTVSGTVVALRVVKPAAINSTSTVTGSVAKQFRLIPASILATSTLSGNVSGGTTLTTPSGDNPFLLLMLMGAA